MLCLNDVDIKLFKPLSTDKIVMPCFGLHTQLSFILTLPDNT